MSRLALAALVLATSSAGCAAARVRPEPSLSSVPALAVSGANPRRWGAPLGFGRYATGPVSGDTTLGWSLGVLAPGAGVAGSTRPYAWTSTGPAGALAAECHERTLEVFAGSLALDVKGASGQPRLACAFRGVDGAAWTLAVRATGRPVPAYLGELRGPGGASYTLRSVHALEGTRIPLGTPAGWVLERGGAPVAMVETVNAGRVWLPGGADEAPVAAAATALLLFSPE
ncbi:MAG: hypothetical protein QM704_23820 [Anaeromyxobacteraceae bacterium]